MDNIPVAQGVPTPTRQEEHYLVPFRTSAAAAVSTNSHVVLSNDGGSGGGQVRGGGSGRDSQDGGRGGRGNGRVSAAAAAVATNIPVVKTRMQQCRSKVSAVAPLVRRLLNVYARTNSMMIFPPPSRNERVKSGLV